MKKLLLLSLFALCSAVALRAEPTHDELVQRLESCRAILIKFKDEIRPEYWAKAKGIIIVNQFKGAFIFGVKDGYGVVMVKRENGLWSLPVLVSAGEASLGLQAGATSVESIYILTDEKTPSLLFKPRFNVGVDAKAVAGQRIAEKEHFNEEILKTPMIFFTKGEGLYAGATVKAGHLSRDDTDNFLLYNTRYTMPELLYSDWVKPTPEADQLMGEMHQIAP